MNSVVKNRMIVIIYKEVRNTMGKSIPTFPVEIQCTRGLPRTHHYCLTSSTYCLHILHQGGTDSITPVSTIDRNVFYFPFIVRQSHNQRDGNNLFAKSSDKGTAIVHVATHQTLLFVALNEQW